MDEEFRALADAVRLRRDVGEVVLWKAPRDASVTHEEAVRGLLADPPAPLVSPARHDWLPDPDPDPGGVRHLQELSPADAEQLLAGVLARDLPYKSELMPEPVAAELARRVVAGLATPARWWTNGSFSIRDGLRSFTPLTHATFDTGVIGVSATQLLVAWVLDED